MERAPVGNGLPWAPVDSPLGLYLHIPFCASICNYCNFNRTVADESVRRAYTEALAREIALYADGSAVDTIYFGGGTPSLLRADDVHLLVQACRTAFACATDVEVTLEGNPEDLAPAYLDGLRHAGITRLSLGAQSFDAVELARLDRRHSARRVRDAVRDSRAAGFDNISLDLMLWLPGQSLDAWLANVEDLIELAPDHASVYMLEIYPNAPLKDAMARDGLCQGGDDLAADMYEAGLDRLERAGYRQYEISNVARSGRYSRHNLKYWTDGTWLGLGAGAHGTRHAQRWRNVAATSDYLGLVGAGRRPVAERRTLDDDTALREALFMGLRLAGGIDLAAFEQRYGCAIMSTFEIGLAPFVVEGLVSLDTQRLRLSRRGMLLANEVFAVFV
ncbi:MAG: radical SAM family heme chaperone HemW [Vicinamibacterales bacterium]